MSAPFALLPYQQAWIADTSQVKVCEKSRRVGLSWCEAADDALLASVAGGMDVWYIGYNKDMALEFIHDTAFWARQYNLAASAMEEGIVDDEGRDILAFRIKFSSGYRVTALSSKPSNLRGKQGKVVIDEAAFHADLAGLLKAAIALLMWGGRVVVISTHNGEDNPFNELVSDIRSGKRPYSLHRIDLDQAIEQGLYHRICLRLAKPWSQDAETAWRQELIDFYGSDADEELFCIPSRGSGLFMARHLVESCMDPAIPVIRWTCRSEFAQEAESVREAVTLLWSETHLAPILDAMDAHRPTVFGQDFGRSGDLSVIVPLQESQGMAFRAPFVLEMRNVPFRQQEQVLFFVVDRMPRFRGGALDARGNGQYLAEVAMQRYGANRIAQVMLTQDWYRDNMPRYRAAFEDFAIALPHDPDILDDHRAIRMDKGVAKVPENYRGRSRDGGQRHGDAAVAGALAWFAARTLEGGPIEYETVIERRLQRCGAY